MDISTLFALWVSISGVATGSVLYVKSLLIQLPIFQDGKNNAYLSILLQTVAGIVGFATAQLSGVNLFTTFASTAAAPLWVSSLAFGLACSLGGQGFYVLISILAGHVVQPAAQDASAPAAYIPFLVVPRASLRAAFIGEAVPLAKRTAASHLATATDMIPHSATPSADDAVIGIHG